MSQETPNVEIDENISEGVITAPECLDHLWNYVRDEKPGLKEFYKDRQALAEQAEQGAEMVRTLISRGCPKEIAMNLSLLTLYDICMLIDDSSSMHDEEDGSRMQVLAKTLRLFTDIYDLANRVGLLSVRFFNSAQGWRKVKSRNVKYLVSRICWWGTTKMGTALQEKVLDMFFHEEIQKPLRIVVITDGNVEGEEEGLLFDVISKALRHLKLSQRLNLDSMAFHFACIGNNDGAKELMNQLSSDREIGSHVHISYLNENIANESERWPMVANLTIGSIVNYKLKSPKNIEHYRMKATPQVGGVKHTLYKSSIPRGQRGYRVNITWKDVSLIGKGASGSVLLQESDQQSPKQLRAVKRLVASKDLDFKTELTTLCEVTRYNDLFVELFGWYEAGGNLFIAMEYVQFGDLSKIGKEERKTHARTITRQTLCALNILHEGGICHRDIKPQNILVASLDPFRIKIADFGASKYLAAEEDFSIVGTPGYMAPELLKMAIIPRSKQGEAIYTLAVDLWSLGTTTAISGLQFTIYTSAGTTPYTPTSGGLDSAALYQFCQGQSVFPSGDLQSAQATEEEIALVLGLLVPNPKNRMSASQALQSDWLRTDC